MKRNFYLFAAAIVCLSLFSGCGLLGGGGVPKEQINTDLANSKIKAQRGNDLKQQTDWEFKDDSYRCFAPITDETKISDTTADMMMNVSAVRLVKSEDTPTLFGKILLRYKKDGGNWKLETIEPKDVRTNEITGDAFSKFIDLQMPLCNYFKFKGKDL